jgi:hypothetical protein
MSALARGLEGLRRMRSKHRRFSCRGTTQTPQRDYNVHFKFTDIPRETVMGVHLLCWFGFLDHLHLIAILRPSNEESGLRQSYLLQLQKGV